MLSKTPKTGLADRMRAAMKARNGKFVPVQLADDLGLPKGKERDKLRNALGDFVKRGEILQVLDKRNRRQIFYRYNDKWRRPFQGTINKKVFKAMYVSIEAFAVTDIQRLSGAKKRSHVEKIVKRLVEAGYLQNVGRRACAHGAGAETLYNVPLAGRDKFRLEVMG